MKDLSVLKALLLQEMDEAEKCNECGGLMEKGMCTECGYMEELTKGQEKIDVAEPKGKITAADFAALRAKKDVKEDHEVGMANNSLESIIKSAMELKAKLGDDERNIPGWIQDHITNAENYIDQAAQGFHELDSHDQEHDMDELPDGTEELPAGDEEDMTLQGLMEKLLEAKKKPSAGLSKKQKSAIVKKAIAKKDIGKKGKGFEKVVKAAEKGGAKDPQAVAAAAMWKGQAKKAMKEDASDWEEGFEWMDELPKQYGNWKIDVADDSIKFDDQPIVWYYKGDENGYRVVYTPNDYYSTDITLYTPGQDMYDSDTDGITLQSIELGDKLDNFSFEKYAKYGARAIAKAEQMIQKAGK